MIDFLPVTWKCCFYSAHFQPGGMFIYLFVCLPVYLTIFLSIHPSSSIYLQAWKWSFSARLPQFWKLATSKGSNSARLPQFSKLTTSKNAAILRDFLQNWKVECRADGLVQMRFAIFSVHVSKVLRLPRKSEARSNEVLHLSDKIIFPKLKIWCSKMQPSQEISVRTC